MELFLCHKRVVRDAHTTAQMKLVQKIRSYFLDIAISDNWIIYFWLCKDPQNLTETSKKVYLHIVYTRISLEKIEATFY